MGDLKVQRFGVKFCLGLVEHCVGERHTVTTVAVTVFGEDAGFWFSHLTRRGNSIEGCEGSCCPSTVRIDENADKVCKIIA